jgi:hypothetical protein
MHISFAGFGLQRGKGPETGHMIIAEVVEKLQEGSSVSDALTIRVQTPTRAPFLNSTAWFSKKALLAGLMPVAHEVHMPLHPPPLFIAQAQPSPAALALP